MFANRLHLKIGLIVFVVIVLGGVGLWLPAWLNIKDMHGQIAKAEEQLGIARGRTDGLAQLAREVEQLRSQVATNNRIIPAQAELANVLRQLSVQLDEHGLTGKGMSTGEARPVADCQGLPVSLTVTGRGQDVLKFVQSVESLPRMIQVESLAMGTGKDQDGRVEADLELTTFFSSSEQGGH